MKGIFTFLKLLMYASLQDKLLYTLCVGGRYMYRVLMQWIFMEAVCVCGCVYVCGGVSLILTFERTANTFPHSARYSLSG